MRIIAGECRGIPLKSIKGQSTRPTSDKVKESIFNIIGPFFSGGTVVDLFGGSGALSLEALSRGADRAYIFENNRQACKVIRANSDKCKYAEKVHLHTMSAKQGIHLLSKQNVEIDYLFLDPPYIKEEFYKLAQQAVEKDLLSEKALIICEHDKKTTLPEAYGPFTIKKANTYGNIAITIYQK